MGEPRLRTNSSVSGWLLANHETCFHNCVEYDKETDEYKSKVKEE